MLNLGGILTESERNLNGMLNLNGIVTEKKSYEIFISLDLQLFLSFFLLF